MDSNLSASLEAVKETPCVSSTSLNVMVQLLKIQLLCPSIDISTGVDGREIN